MSKKVLLADLSNGEYVKLAVSVAGARPANVGHYACTSLPDLENAILSFCSDGGVTKLDGAALSASGWEVDGHIDLVHFGFTLERRSLAELLGVSRVSIINDFVAKALAVPVLKADERVQVCGDDIMPEQVVAVVGPTTGLGGAYLSPDGRGGWIASHCEGGHSDLAPCNELEMDILRIMMRKYGHVSSERAVSAPGLTELWRCLTILDSDEESLPTAEEILAQAYIDNPRAKKAIHIQTELFAGVASDLALTVGAKGGVYLCGSYLDLLGPLFDREVFARRFYDKGRVSSYLRDVPVYKIVADEPEILGLSTLLE